MQKFDSSCFRGKNYFGDDETQNYLVFQPIAKYFKIFISILPYVTSWESKGLSNDVIKPPTASNNSFVPNLLGDDDRLDL